MAIDVRVLALVLALASGGALADEDGWTTVVQGPPVTVKNKPRPGSEVKDVWVEGEIGAPLQDIHAALMDVPRFKHFMPNLKVSRILGKPEPDGSLFVYTELALPAVLTARDYVVHVWNDEVPKADGTGAFRQHWVSVPDRLPSRNGVIRLTVNDGSWHITPLGDGKKSWAVHKFAVDPGGWVPAFAADLGNKQGVADLYRAIEKEALRRTAAREQAPGGPSRAVAEPAK